MTRREAIQALANGERVCHPKAWMCSYLYMDFETGQVRRAGGDEASMQAHADGWEIYTTPARVNT